jgi:FkbM family methyltransferase
MGKRFELIQMIKKILKALGLHVHAKFIREKYFPAQSQQNEKNIIPQRVKFYEQFLSRGNLCFDIGANIGNRTRVFLQLGARVVAIEPQSECVKMLKLRFGKKISIVPKALGKEEKDGVIYIGESSAISSLSTEWIETVSKVRFKGKRWNRQEAITITTLDKLIEQYGMPQFCKIDVEGYEEEVLKGLSKKIPYLSLEYALPEKKTGIVNCLSILSNIGEFECNYTIGEKMALELPTWVRSEELVSRLNSIPSPNPYGDIYIRFRD